MRAAEGVITGRRDKDRAGRGSAIPAGWGSHRNPRVLAVAVLVLLAVVERAALGAQAPPLATAGDLSACRIASHSASGCARRQPGTQWPSW